MDGQSVQYEITLKDLLSEKLQKAEGHASKLEHSLHNLAERAVHTLESLGVSFAAFEGYEFVKDSVADVEHLNESIAQVKAGLLSTQGAAGMTFEELSESAEKFRDKVNYSKADIFDLQAQLLTFGGVTEQNFNDISEATMNVATKTHHGLTEMAIMMGKAMDNPAEGLNKLVRAGVMFDAGEKQRIAQLMAHGEKVKAQQIMLAEIANKYGGSAAAARAADPLAKFKQDMEEVKEAVGGLAIDLLHALTPALEAVIGAVKTAVQWMKDHKDIMMALGATVAVIAGGFTIYSIITSAASIATSVWTGAQWLLNAALTANPIGIVIVAVGALVGAIVYAYNHTAKFRGILMGTWEFMKALFNWIVVVPVRVLMGLGEMMAGVFTFDIGKIKSGFNSVTSAFKEGAINLATSFKKGYDEGMSSFNADHKSIMPKAKTEKKGHEANPTFTPTKGPKASTAGTKSIKIDIKIGQLIGKYENHIMNMKGSVENMKDHVTAALLSAVNDSQIVAGL